MKKLPYLIGVIIGILLGGIIMWNFKYTTNSIYWFSIGLYIPEVSDWIIRKLFLYFEKKHCETIEKLDIICPWCEGNGWLTNKGEPITNRLLNN